MMKVQIISQEDRGSPGVLSNGTWPSVVFGSMKTKVGMIFLAVSDEGLCDLTIGDLYSEDSYHDRLVKLVPKIRRDCSLLRFAISELKEYFSGQRKIFSVPVDLRGVSHFTAKVLRETLTIPFGRLTTYGNLADRLSSPKAYRAVGSALGRNPVPIVIPCHRVIGNKGRLGGFTSGLLIKRSLLRLEGHVCDSSGKNVNISFQDKMSYGN